MKAKIAIGVVGFLLIFLFRFDSVNAESSYVLPYPSAMPGNKLYKLIKIKDDLSRYWYFGDFAQFEYNLKLSDKYLVEAKTLFEYKQYLLGVESLKLSDSYFKKALPNLLYAQENGKNISDKLLIFKSASEKHIETLNEVVLKLPEHFTWTPEKKNSSELALRSLISESIETRISK